MTISPNFLTSRQINHDLSLLWILGNKPLRCHPIFKQSIEVWNIRIEESDSGKTPHSLSVQNNNHLIQPQIFCPDCSTAQLQAGIHGSRGSIPRVAFFFLKIIIVKRTIWQKTQDLLSTDAIQEMVVELHRIGSFPGNQSFRRWSAAAGIPNSCVLWQQKK